MSDIPDREQIEADERQMGELLRAVEAPAPARLHAQLNTQIAARNAARRPWWQGAPAIALGLAGAATAACVALLIVLTSGSGAAAPTVISASRLALARPTQPARPGLVASGTNIAFPDWSKRGWPAKGMRDDELGSRAVTTVFYRSYEKGTAGYAIVAGAPLRWGASGFTTGTGGRRYTIMSSGGARIVTWVQDGHTCIVASRTASPQTLLALASAEQHSAAA